MEDSVTIDTKKKKAAEGKVFVPYQYLCPSLHKRILYVHPIGEGASFTQIEFRQLLKQGSIHERVLRDLAFKVY